MGDLVDQVEVLPEREHFLVSVSRELTEWCVVEATQGGGYLRLKR